MDGNKMVDDIMTAEVVFVDVCESKKCQTEYEELETEYNSCKNEIARIQKLYHETLISNLKKDLKIRELESKLKIQNETKFDEFSESLSPEAIRELQMIENVPGKDSNFMLHVMSSLYKDDFVRLKNKTFGEKRRNYRQKKKC